MSSSLTTLKVLFVLTSQNMMETVDQPTGVWLEEFSTPYYVLQDAGVEVDVASIQGGKAPLDPRSIRFEGENPESVDRFLADEKTIEKLENSLSINQVDYRQYDAIYLPGGHGTMWDFPNDQMLAEIIANAWQDGKVVATVCHGAAGLVNVFLPDGKSLVAGKKLTAFSNEEEQGAQHLMPFLLETRLKELGADYSSGDKFKAYAIQDGNLITGQNPASSELVAELLLRALQEDK